MLKGAKKLTNVKHTCFPVHNCTGWQIAGLGIANCLSPSPANVTTLQNSSRGMKTSFCVRRKELVMKSCVALTRGEPFLGVQILFMTPMSSSASALASSVWGTCRFISSPSKSALYGAHTLIKAKRAPFKHSNSVRHDALLMQRWLAIEQNNITIDKVALNNVTNLQRSCVRFKVAVL